MTSDNLNIRLDEDITSQLTVNKNLSQEIIVTNTDKVKIILSDHHKIIKRKIEWLNPLGIFVTVLATLLTAQFNKVVWGIEAVLWKAIFVVTGIAAFGYSIYLIIYAIKYFNNGTVEEFIEKLKNQSQEIRETVAPKSTKQTIITIHSAQYGTDKKYNNIEERILKMVLNKDYIILATNNLWKDPAVGEPKTLRLDISINDIRKNIVVPENKEIDLRDYFENLT